jgi:hypothetical protein
MIIWEFALLVGWEFDFPKGRATTLGLLEFAFLPILMVALIQLDHRSRRAGVTFISFLLIYGTFRLAVNQLHTDRDWWGDLYGGSLVAALGFVAWVVRPRYTSTSNLGSASDNLAPHRLLLDSAHRFPKGKHGDARGVLNGR